MPAYDSPIRMSYNFDTKTLSSLAQIGQMAGPSGLRGRIVAVAAVLTTATTVAASVVSIGNNSDVDKYATLAVPVALIDTIHNDFVSLTTDDALIAADTIVTLETDGGCTAGAASVNVVIDWFI